jgi:hypothetical protein
VLVVVLSSGPANAEQPYAATLYKNPQCGCCETYADYLRENGFEVTVKPTHDLPLMKRQMVQLPVAVSAVMFVRRPSTYCRPSCPSQTPDERVPAGGDGTAIRLTPAMASCAEDHDDRAG